MWIQPLSLEDPLEKKMAAHSSVLAWEILQTEGPGGVVHGVTRVGHNERLSSSNDGGDRRGGGWAWKHQLGHGCDSLDSC